MSVRARQQVELAIATAVASDLIEAGYSVTVFDGEEETLKKSRDVAAIIGAMFTTDEDRLIVHMPGIDKPQGDGWVLFIYGNDGWDVVSDYTTNLEPILSKSARAISDEFSEVYSHKPAPFPARPVAVILTGEEWTALLARTVSGKGNSGKYALSLKGAAIYKRAASKLGAQLEVASKRGRQ